MTVKGGSDVGRAREEEEEEEDDDKSLMRVCLIGLSEARGLWALRPVWVSSSSAGSAGRRTATTRSRSWGRMSGIAGDGTLSPTEFRVAALAFAERWKSAVSAFPPWSWLPRPKHPWLSNEVNPLSFASRPN